MSEAGDRPPDVVTVNGQEGYPSFAFLVHSQTTLMQDLPPKVDRTMTARQRRRRTSPEDHAVLEEAYQSNSKPDKSERIGIVNRVALGEKEVQIWFQNRRQNDRRKSRPLLPHELVPHFRNHVPQALLQKSSSEHIVSLVQPVSSFPAIALHLPLGNTPPEELELASSRSSSIHDLLNCPPSFESHTSTSFEQSTAEVDNSQTSLSSVYASTENASQTRERTESSRETTESNAISEPPPTGVKRNYDEIDELKNDAKGSAVPQPPILLPQGSNVRLSMSLDGAVKVKTNDEETPSPPKERAPAPPFAFNGNKGLQRSKSAVIPGQNSVEEPTIRRNSKPAGLFGRSRDARTWEFYCDSDARDALSVHAESERTGSAVGAINLIRSQSQKARAQMMGPGADGSSARNMQPSLRGNQKPKLSRAKSSMGRLQQIDKSESSNSLKSGPPMTTRAPSGDSDKENWAPGTRLSNNPLRRHYPNPNPSRRPILGDNGHIPSHARSLVGALAADRRHIRGVKRWNEVATERAHAESGEEIKAFMKDGDKGEDLDCIQGLLSLSQGAWQ